MSGGAPRVADELLAKYGRHGPRYTSYPPVPAWHEGVGARELAAELATLGGAPPAAGEADAEIYVHVPFCARLCTFCGCHTFITRAQEPLERWFAALRAEADAVARAAGRRLAIGALHLGGGTPTHLDEPRLAALLDLLEERFDFAACREKSLEVHPHVTRRAQLELLAARGFARLSMGVQDLTPEVQAAIHRFQTAEETAALVADARALGFTSINADLVYGLPRQTLAGFARTIEQVIAMGVDRLAVYGYAHVPWLKRAQRAIDEATLPDPRLRADLCDLALERLAAAGYEPIGFDHFARPQDELFRARDAGTLTRNFMGYAVRRAGALIGLGPSAIGEVGRLYAQNHDALEAWAAAIGRDGLATRRGFALSPEDALRRDVIRSLLCLLRVDGAAIGARHGVDFERRFAAELAALAPMAQDGLLRIEGATLELSGAGRYLARNAAMAFDQHLGEPAGGPRFSRTV